jgi:exopolyphosphatase/guanosine-5'-triphosphate,3'-diphosphate pyrophosphatase
MILLKSGYYYKIISRGLTPGLIFFIQRFDMRVAVIDIGSNSIRLLVAHYNSEKDVENVVPFYRELITTRLGRGVAINNIIDELSCKNTVLAVKAFISRAHDFGCDIILSIATSAVREALNGPDFLQLLKKKTGLDVNIISGQEEAELSFLGARAGLRIAGLTLVMDIGGNSTELSLGDDSQVIRSISVPVGAVRLTQRYYKSGIPTDAEFEKAKNTIRKEFYDFGLFFAKLSSSRRVEIIGVGGTLTTLAAIKLGIWDYDPEIIHGLYLSSSDIEDIYNKLLSLSLEELKLIPGLPSKRADIIKAGVLIMYEIMRVLDIPGITVSEFDIMEGFILKKLLKTQ